MIRCAFADGRWQVTTASGPPRRGRRGHRRHRCAPPPEVPRHRRARPLRRAPCSTAPAGTTPSSLDGARVGHHRHRVDRRADRLGRRRPGGRSSRCSSARRSGSCRRTTRPTPTRSGPPSATTRAPGGSYQRPLRHVRRVRQRRGRRRVARDQVDRAGLPGQPREQRHDPELRERLRPNYRAACKRLVISPDFYEAIQQPQRRAGHRAPSSGSSPPGCAPPTAGCTSSTSSCWPPASRSTPSCDPWR